MCSTLLEIKILCKHEKKSILLVYLGILDIDLSLQSKNLNFSPCLHIISGNAQLNQETWKILAKCHFYISYF